MERSKKEDLDDELFRIVQGTACRFANDIEKLGRRYHRLRMAADPGRLRSRVESSLMSLVSGRAPASRGKRNHKPSPKRATVSDWSDWPELPGDESDLRIVRVMPHDEGDYEALLPDDPDPKEVTRTPSFWRWLTYSLFRR